MAKKVKIPAEQLMTDYTLAKAGFDLYCVEYASIFEEHGGSFGAGANINDCVAKLSADDTQAVIKMMRQYEQKLADAWGKAPGWVYAEMGLEDEDDIANAFYHTMMGCMGHGVCLKDDHGEEIDLYESKHDPLSCWSSPFHTELTDVNELAYENLETPNPQWGVYDEKNELVEDKFHSEDAAERYLSDTGFGDDGYTVRLMNDVKNSYPDGVCPDCGDDIPDTVVDGEECLNCRHVFVLPQPNDGE